MTTDNKESCRQISNYIHSFWKHLRVLGCLCVDDKIANPKSFKEANVEAINSPHLGSWGKCGQMQRMRENRLGIGKMGPVNRG